MKLNEILNKKVEFDVVEDTKSIYKTSATIAGRQIVFTATHNDHAATEGKWEVEFTEMFDDGSDGTHDLTGAGGELEVFAMVKGSIEALIKKHKPELISFTADKRNGKNNRASLYDRFLKRFMIRGYSYERLEGGSRDKFYLEKD